MKGVLAALLCTIALLATGCARHVVVERDAGRVDGVRSITSASETDWTIVHEPGSPARTSGSLAR